MASIDRLLSIMQRLRDPENGCPWDLEQTYATIAPHTIEEAYEVVDAIDRKHMDDLKSELGDLLFQVIFYSQMASEDKLFSFEDVVEAICHKMIKRHPHIFSDDSTIKTASDQEVSWEKQKQLERQQQADDMGKKASILDGVAVTLPGMVRALKLQKRAAKVGFDWSNIESVFDKIYEELDELKYAYTQDTNIEEEMGDVLFVMVNLCRKLNIDPETAIKQCNRKFQRRFHYIEQVIENKGDSIERTPLEVLDALWEECKETEKS